MGGPRVCHPAQQPSATCLKTLKPWEFDGGAFTVGFGFWDALWGRDPPGAQSRVATARRQGLGVGVETAWWKLGQLRFWSGLARPAQVSELWSGGPGKIIQVLEQRD